MSNTPTVNSGLDIPESIVSVLFPISDCGLLTSQNASALTLINFNEKNLPNTTSATPVTWLENEKLFTPATGMINDPNKSSFLRSQCPIPPLSEIEDILDKAKAAHESGHKSFLYLIKDTHMRLPLWVLTYWKYVYTIKTHQDLWRRAKQWLHDHSFIGRDVTFFNAVPWQWSSQNLGDALYLTKFLSDQWLGAENVNQMLARAGILQELH
ncbi:hypothetical protein K435DRAFT_855256 [Dendrothele bispora CBS 962.96]|uniref:Uncharacterized protein n=1 Tax=Dendrothele bispora (strain CBS 962.96) TaxID=1314807 RepID=A0A4S8MBL9_DENBC|nr:hypothetical protein K435DRAFT_855256 [Dendrothele bispora CBS 962.96]